MSALHLGVSVGVSVNQGGGAALYADERPLLAFDEAPLTGAHSKTYADQPPRPPLRLPLHKLLGSDVTLPSVPREAIRACLKGAGVTWSDLSSVSVAGPTGSLERLSVEYAEHVGFQDLLNTHQLSAQRALAELALNVHPVEEAVTLVMSSERRAHLGDEGELSAYAIYQSYQSERDLLFERRLDAQRGSLLSPVSAYLALIEQAREALGVTLQASTHPVEWASQLAAHGEPLSTLKTWFSLRSESLEVEVSSYAMWLEILSLARRLEALTPQFRGDLIARRLWASLLRKAQEELGATLVSLAKRSLRHAQRTRLLFVGELALDPALCAALRSAHPSATVHTLQAPLPRAAALGAALYGAQEHARAVTKGLISATKEPLRGGWLEDLTLSARRAQRPPRDELLHELYGDEAIEQSASQLTHLLKVTRSEPVERARRFAQVVARGGVVAHFKGPPSLLSSGQSARLCLSDPSQPNAPATLNKTLKRALDEPTFLVCPAEHAGVYFDDLSPHEGAWQLASLKRSGASEVSEHVLRLTPSLRPDQRALVLTLDATRDPELCALCEALTLHFNRPPVLLASPFCLTSGELVDRPSDALHALVNTPRLSLMMGSLWLTSTLPTPSSLTLSPSAHPQSPAEPGQLERDHQPLFQQLNEELKGLDASIFHPHKPGLQWSSQHLDELSYLIAPYRPLSHYFESALLCEPLFKPLSGGGVTAPPSLSLHPRGLSRLTCPSARWPTRLYTWPQTLTLIALGKPRAEVEQRLSRRLHLPPYEREALIAWGRAELEGLGLSLDETWRAPSRPPALPPPQPSELLLGPLQHPQADLYAPLHELWRALKRCGYDEACLAPFRGDRVGRPLSERPADLLVRLFWRGEPLSRRLIQGCLGDEVTRTLIELGALSGKEELAAQLRLDCVAGAYVASDRPHPLKLTAHERAAPPLTSLQRGLVRLALTRRIGASFDLSNTLGAVSVALARQARPLYLSVPHERAYRFTAFNLQLNGVRGYHLELSERATLRSPRTYPLVFASDPEPLRYAGALLAPQGRLVVMTPQLSQASATPVSVLHRALALPLTGAPQPLESCAQVTEQSLQGRGGYWVIQQEEALTPHAERPQVFLRALEKTPCEALCDYVDRYFTQPLSAHLMSYPLPSLSLEQHLNVSGEERTFARDLSCESLARVALRPEVYAHLKAELTQRRPSPLSPLNLTLVLAGLKLTTPR